MPELVTCDKHPCEKHDMRYGCGCACKVCSDNAEAMRMLKDLDWSE